MGHGWFAYPRGFWLFALEMRCGYVGNTAQQMSNSPEWWALTPMSDKHMSKYVWL